MAANDAWGPLDKEKFLHFQNFLLNLCNCDHLRHSSRVDSDKETSHVCCCKFLSQERHSYAGQLSTHQCLQRDRVRHTNGTGIRKGGKHRNGFRWFTEHNIRNKKQLRLVPKKLMFSRQLQRFIMNIYGNLRKNRSQDFDKTLVLPVWHLCPINPYGHTQTCLFFVWLYAQSPVWQGDGRPHFDEFPDQKDIFRDFFHHFRP